MFSLQNGHKGVAEKGFLVRYEICIEYVKKKF